MKIQENISLKKYNTFGIDVNAERFIEINSIDQLSELFSSNLLNNVFVVGGGSNMLLTRDIKELVVKMNILGKSIYSEKNNKVIVKSSAGEDWPEFVLWTIEKGLSGLENLSKIPGNVGTSPIQNIGAYGVEVKDTFLKLDALEIATGKIKTIYKNECNFGYRESIFKTSKKGKFIIVNVYFELEKNGEINTTYGAINTKLSEKGITNPTAKDVSDSIIEIRSCKLPDPNKIGNSGSFFKNPVISASEFSVLKEQYADIPSYVIDEDNIKVPAGWLIDKLGWKGYRIGDAGVHENQALVLVNYGNATGNNILNLAKEIQIDIKLKFGILLEIEVNIV